MKEQKQFTIFSRIDGSMRPLHRHNNNILRIKTEDIRQYLNDDLYKKEQLEAKEKINECIKKGESLIQETTLTDPSIFQTIKNARKEGYSILLDYVGVNNADILKERLDHNDKNKGNTTSISSEIIAKKYQESLHNLKEIIPLCDSVTVHDNTDIFSKVMHIENGKLIKSHYCEWFNPIFEQIQENRIKMLLRQGQFQTNPKLIQDIMKIQKVFGEEYNLKEIRELYRKRENLDPEKKHLIEEVGKDFIQAEKEALHKQAILQSLCPEL